MILLDTHVLVWLYAGDVERFPAAARDRLEREPIYSSPISTLELEYLHEIGRLSVDARTILTDLDESLELVVLDHPVADLVERARPLSWTRDPFDRLIAAHALATDLRVLTKDERLREHLPLATWN